MAKRGNKDRPHTQAAATGNIDPRVTLGIMAEHDFTGANSLRRNASISLETDPKVRCSAAGASAADNFISGTECNRGSGGTGQMLGTLGDGTDRGLKVEFRRVKLDFFRQRDGAKTGCGVRCIR